MFQSGATVGAKALWLMCLRSSKGAGVARGSEDRREKQRGHRDNRVLVGPCKDSGSHFE